MKLASLLALALVTAGACSNKAPGERKEAVATAAEEPQRVERAPAEPAAPVAQAPNPAPAGVPNDFPPECAGYATLIDKLKACDRIGGARAALTQAYDNLRSAWSMVPAERRPEIATQCKTQADSLRNAAAATCGW
ncbi:MAG TPA: hypothetical protein VFD36_10925 [Kofleriaceae bacterium]|nr:hypothetical protein [Kofleriaceae bacterium]